uniref:Uncharacterized protein n=1 Tax=Rhipicephalus appendiculatus TaxID=34631 RepID=A0A131YER2_RHIAP
MLSSPVDIRTRHRSPTTAVHQPWCSWPAKIALQTHKWHCVLLPCLPLLSLSSINYPRPFCLHDNRDASTSAQPMLTPTAFNGTMSTIPALCATGPHNISLLNAPNCPYTFTPQ